METNAESVGCVRQTWVVCLAVAGLIAGSLITMGETAPQVRQPDDPSYTPEVRAALAQGTQALRTILATPYSGSQKVLGAGGWGTREFSIYTAGALGERGYSTVVVEAVGSANARTWVLVAIPAAGTIAWVPVEPSPGAGLPQTVLGSIPMNGSAFASNYVTYAGPVPVPANASPIARIRPPSARPMPNQTTELMAFGSSDADGYIVVYRWDFGDGATALFTTATAYHEFPAVGNYTLTLTVIDNGGRSGTTTWVLVVGSDAPTSGEKPKPDCGCGG